jgi:hypothetical protein
MNPLPAKIERKIPVNKIHLLATNDSSFGNNIHENDPKMVIRSAIFRILAFFSCRKPNRAAGTKRPFTAIKEINRLNGL